jgi:hypothetical protein
MRDGIVKDLSSAIDALIAEALVGSYEELMASHASGDLDRCLTKAGLFVEHALRAVESIRTGVAPKEIKSVSATVRAFEADTTLPDSLRYLIPRVAYGMIYDVRSKRGVVHVKEIDPRRIDASLATHAASWVLAEFLRLYHSGDEAVVAKAIDALMRTHVPFVESFGAERVGHQESPVSSRATPLTRWRC